MYIGREGDPATNIYTEKLAALLDARKVYYHPYPRPDTPEIQRYEKLVGGTNQRAFDANLTLFCGQVPYDLPHPFIPWALDLLLNDYASSWVKPTDRMGGAKVWVNYPEQSEQLRSLTEHLLFDVCGVWVAQDKETVAKLRDVAKHSCESRLARSAMTIVQATHVVHCDKAPHWSERLITVEPHLTPIVGVRPSVPTFVPPVHNPSRVPQFPVTPVLQPALREGFSGFFAMVKVPHVKVCRPGS